jgi:hypothetical protein
VINNIIMSLMQLEWVNLELKQRSYAFMKVYTSKNVIISDDFLVTLVTSVTDWYISMTKFTSSSTITSDED